MFLRCFLRHCLSLVACGALIGEGWSQELTRDYSSEGARSAALEFKFKQGDDPRWADYAAKYLAVRKHGRIELIAVDDLLYAQGAGAYSELVLTDGRRELHDKTLEKLTAVLPRCSSGSTRVISSA